MANAILINFNKNLRNINNLLLINSKRNFFLNYKNDNNVNDVIDVFVTNHVKSSQEKWSSGILKKYVNSILTIKNVMPSESKLNIELIDEKKLKESIIFNIKMKNYTNVCSLLQICNDKKIYLSNSDWMVILHKLSLDGQTKGINIIQDIFFKNNPQQFLVSGKLQDFEAAAFWINGEDDNSLELFYKVFIYYPLNLGRTIKLLQLAIKNTIDTKEEYALIQMRYFVEKLSIDEISSIPLFYFWQECFLSKKYYNQELANHIMEQNPKLPQLIRPQITILAQISFTCHNLETINRIIEIILLYNWTAECRIIFQLLFDYHFMHRNYQACMEIVKTSIHLNISLSSTQHQKFLWILMKNGKDAQEYSFLSDQPKEILWKF